MLFGIFGALFAGALAGQSFLGAALFAGLHVVGVPLDILDDIFLLHLPFEAPERAFQSFTVLDDYFCQMRDSPLSAVETDNSYDTRMRRGYLPFWGFVTATAP